MAANQNVVDELVVKLTLDAEQYKKANKVIVQLVDRTEKKQQQADVKRKKRETEQIKRNKETLKSVKDLAMGFRTLTATIGAMLGIGSAAGLVGAVVALAGMETNLRRAAVSTGLSNRELQAWGSTARRLGADAQAGASAIADLAREQKQFNLTGQAPTIQAFARMGVRVGPNSSIVDILSQAQQIYRQAQPAQRTQIESGLAAQGVSADLIVAIKSEKDVREEFARSYDESATENRKALDALTDALVSLGSTAVNIANSIATVVQPYVEQFAHYVSEGAQQLSAFVDRVIAAGGGVDGFMKVLDEESPEIASLLRDVGTGLKVMAEAVDLATYGLKLIGQGLKSVYDWLDQKLSLLAGGNGQSHPLKDAVSTVGDAIKWAWKSSLQDARAEGVTHLSAASQGAALTPSAARRVSAGALIGTSAAPAAGPTATASGRRGAPSATAQDLMGMLVTRYGLSVAQAAAVVANAEGESSLFAGAVNTKGGGTGARGLFQWRGPRTAAFQQRFGTTPDRASVEQQLDFLMSDPYERRLMLRALSGGRSAAAYGARFNNIFEANGRVGEAAKRAARAQQLASAYGGTNGAGAGQQYNIQSMTVQANNPQELARGISRISTPQNYNSGVK